MNTFEKEVLLKKYLLSQHVFTSANTVRITRDLSSDILPCTFFRYERWNTVSGIQFLSIPFVCNPMWLVELHLNERQLQSYVK